MQQENEIWKDVIGFEGYYQISNLGRVKSLARWKQNHSKKQFIKERIMKPYLSVGYWKITLMKFHKSKKYFIHRLLGIHFIPNPENKPEINHMKGIKTNLDIKFLEWATGKENAQHAVRTGLRIFNPKKIIQLDLNGNFIREWESTKIAGENGFRASCINKVITGMQKKHAGYLWKYSKS